MDKITVKKVPFKLIGDIVESGSLSFVAKNKENREVYIDDVKGLKVISIFPKLNTSVCDEQTMKIAELAKKYDHLKFISITMDDVETINKWCLSHGQKNVEIWSDREYMDFAGATNSFIPKMNVLNRGLILLDENNTIINALWNKELSQMPDFETIEKYLG